MFCIQYSTLLHLILLYTLYLQLTAKAAYFKSEEFVNSDRMIGYKEKLVLMSWRSSSDYVNCGVYLMHHMETFNGHEDWTCQFSNSNQVIKIDCLELIIHVQYYLLHILLIYFWVILQDVVLVKLRVRYCSELILHPCNQHKEKVMNDARSRRME